MIDIVLWISLIAWILVISKQVYIHVRAFQKQRARLNTLKGEMKALGMNPSSINDQFIHLNQKADAIIVSHSLDWINSKDLPEKINPKDVLLLWLKDTELLLKELLEVYSAKNQDILEEVQISDIIALLNRALSKMETLIAKRYPSVDLSVYSLGAFYQISEGVKPLLSVFKRYKPQIKNVKRFSDKAKYAFRPDKVVTDTVLEIAIEEAFRGILAELSRQVGEEIKRTLTEALAKKAKGLDVNTEFFQENHSIHESIERAKIQKQIEKVLFEDNGEYQYLYDNWQKHVQARYRPTIGILGLQNADPNAFLKSLCPQRIWTQETTEDCIVVKQNNQEICFPILPVLSEGSVTEIENRLQEYPCDLFILLCNLKEVATYPHVTLQKFYDILADLPGDFRILFCLNRAQDVSPLDLDLHDGEEGAGPKIKNVSLAIQEWGENIDKCIHSSINHNIIAFDEGSRKRERWNSDELWFSLMQTLPPSSQTTVSCLLEERRILRSVAELKKQYFLERLRDQKQQTFDGAFTMILAFLKDLAVLAQSSNPHIDAMNVLLQEVNFSNAMGLAKDELLSKLPAIMDYFKGESQLIQLVDKIANNAIEMWFSE